MGPVTSVAAGSLIKLRGGHHVLHRMDTGTFQVALCSDNEKLSGATNLAHRDNMGIINTSSAVTLLALFHAESVAGLYNCTVHGP